MSEAARQRELRKQNRLLVRQESLAERDLIRIIRAMADQLASSITPGATDAMLQMVEEARPAIQEVLRKRILQTALLFGERTLDRLEAMVPKSYRPVEAKGFREIFESAIRQWVELHALSRAVTITGTLKEAVRALLDQGMDEGWGVSELARRIRDSIGGRLSLTNAARIARTEMHTAATTGADEAARSTGLELVKEWAAAEDLRTRISHSLADGQTVRLDEPFIVGTAKLMIPGDPAGPAKEVINCRCAILHHPVIGGEIIR